ncbi:MAG TPA: hypothetical protein ENO03_08050 [Candidatus Aminicenantes bacterium]|nr:hypothetical protein [Candidatus Aminicenantes bacterium]
MSGERNSDMDRDVDKLLREALAEDLPADVEAGMRRTIGRFREAKEESGARVWPRGAAARAWFSRRTVWAVLSILMLVAGALLQGLGSRNRLADDITQVMAEFAGAELGQRPGIHRPLIKENEP